MKLAAAGALAWILFCLRWFDVGAEGRPAWFQAVPPFLLLGLTLVLGTAWLRSRRDRLAAPPLGEAWSGLWLVAFVAFAFRLPFAWHAAASSVTPDGALSGIVALHVREGIERLVFVPNVPYSGSLKSHLAALFALGIDPARAFALASLVFYAAFTAGVYRLALLARDRAAALAASLYVAVAPAYVTRYSLSNDGNYVEVLALGTWALWLGARWVLSDDDRTRLTLSLAAGLLLGLGFWCHILAVIHLAAVGLLMLRAPRSLAALGGGFLLGYTPGLLWNAINGWESFLYLIPGGAVEGGAPAFGLGAKLVALFREQLPFLLGYDFGYSPLVDGALATLSGLAVVLAVAATALVARQRSSVVRVLLIFAAVDLLMVLFALPHIPGNPRYLLFLMAPLPVFLALVLDRGWKRALLAGLIALGALGSAGHLPGAVQADAKWRTFVRELQAEGVRFCYTDFHLATKINFLSAESVVCSAKLGPNTGEYFFAYRRQVEQAPEAALVAVNRVAADRLEKRLRELGVTYERRELMKPVLLRLSRKVDPEELFPGREFPLR